MAWPKLLILVRHAESEGNIKTVDERALFGKSTHEYGRHQANCAGIYLKEKYGEFDIYYTSYYRRSKETMRAMYPNVKIYEDPRLAEAQRGIYHTMTLEHIQLKYPEELIRKEREGLYHYRPLGGENWPDVELRIHSFLGTLSRDYEDQKVLIVVHGHWLLLFQRLIHHFSIEEALRRYQNAIFANASVTIYSGQTRNNHSYLILKEENIIPWKA